MVLLSVVAVVAVLKTTVLLPWLRWPLATGQLQRHGVSWVCLGPAVGITVLGTSAWTAR